MNKKGALGAVFLVVLVDLLGFGIVLPLLPFTAARFDAPPVLIGLLYSIYSFAQLVFSPLWGAWSDRIGRRPVMLLSTLGSAASYVVFAFSNSLTVLFFSRLVAGVMGGNISAAQAYVADVTSPSERAKGMGLLGAAFGIGFAAGPALSSLLLMTPLAGRFPENPLALPGLAAAALSLSSFFLVLFLLPESVTAAAPGGDDGSRVNKLSVFSARFWTSLFLKDGGSLGALYLCLFLVTVGHSSLYSSFPLYCQHHWGLDARHVGFQFLVMGVVAILVQGGMIRPLVRAFGERRVLLCGNVLMTLGLFLIPAASSTGALTAGLVVLALGGSLNGPTLTSLVSKHADPSRLGLAMGNAQSISALARVLGPAWGGWLFGIREPAPFLATALLVFATVWIAAFAKWGEMS